MQRPEDIPTDSRIKRGKDEDRFYCPYPGCTRSFAELWRLKVHYRAPPDVRGSGKERGHGTELQFCPKCGKELKPGKHHVGCFAGRAGPRQAAKRARDEVRGNSFPFGRGSCMPHITLHSLLDALPTHMQTCRSWLAKSSMQTMHLARRVSQPGSGRVQAPCQKSRVKTSCLALVA